MSENNDIDDKLVEKYIKILKKNEVDVTSLIGQIDASDVKKGISVSYVHQIFVGIHNLFIKMNAWEEYLSENEMNIQYQLSCKVVQIIITTTEGQFTFPISYKFCTGENDKDVQELLDMT